MSSSLPDLHSHLSQFTKPILDSLSKTPYTHQETSRISTKSILENLLSTESSVIDFALACALLSTSRSSTHELLQWIPGHLSTAAEAAFSDLSKAYNDAVSGDETRHLAAELMPEIFPALKDKIKESSIEQNDNTDKIPSASARPSVGFAILAAYQFRWFVSQIAYPDLNKMINLVIPCALACLDHWSSEVKGQGMISFIHVAKNVKGTELDCHGSVILTACRKNIAASTDDIWQYAVEMSALLVTCIERDNPIIHQCDDILNEMLNRLEKQPFNKERCIAWLKCVEPIFNCLGIFLLVFLRRIMTLFFRWMRVCDDETILLALKQLQTLVRLTWRRDPFDERLVDTLVLIFKEAELRMACNEIQTGIRDLLIMLQQYRGLKFERDWKKHQDDRKLTTLAHSLSTSSDYYLNPVRPENVFKPLRIDGPKPKQGSEIKVQETKPKPKTIDIDDQTWSKLKMKTEQDTKP